MLRNNKSVIFDLVIIAGPAGWRFFLMILHTIIIGFFLLFYPIAGKRANDTKLGKDRDKMLY